MNVSSAFDGLRDITIEAEYGLDREMRSRHEKFRWAVRKMLIDKMLTPGAPKNAHTDWLISELGDSIELVSKRR